MRFSLGACGSKKQNTRPFRSFLSPKMRFWFWSENCLILEQNFESGLSGVPSILVSFSQTFVRLNSHRTRMGNTSKWDLLMWMGVFTLLASNIKGKTFQSACASRRASCVNEAFILNLLWGQTLNLELWLYLTKILDLTFGNTQSKPNTVPQSNLCFVGVQWLENTVSLRGLEAL